MAAPPNDSPAGAGVFAPYAAPNGTPEQQEALADLGTATADPGVPRCLGPRSFARTVWYRVPESPAARLLTVEASGRTTAPIDLAAFVQPAVAPYAAGGANTREPNACDGVGAGAGADAADRTSAVSLLVPAGSPVLFQVGRRGSAGATVDESVAVALESTDVSLAGAPRGDRATSAPRLGQGSNRVDLAGATLTSEDPAEPPCPALGTVWRKVIAGSDGPRLISVSGHDAASLTVFTGRRPTGDSALDCVVRRTSGALQMVVPVRRRKPVWVRVGTDSFAGDEEVTVSVRNGAGARVINGGPGGFDPTPGGPAGGLPGFCDSADATAARLSGPSLRGGPGDLNRVLRIPLRVRLTGSALCDATVRLLGPGGRVYAQGRYPALRRGGLRRLTIPRLRTFVPGRYRLEATGLDGRGRRARATTKLTGRLAKGNR